MTTALPLVSIGIPTHGRADRYLPHAIRAAMNQTYPALEIIVADNCSPDQTEHVVRELADPRIRYFRHAENIGMNNNYNFCIERARGAFVLLLPDDDLIDSDFIETCLATAHGDTSVGIIRTGTRIIGGDGDTIAECPNNVAGLSSVDFFLGWFGHATSPYLCSTLFNTRQLKDIGGFRSKHNLFQDVGAAARLATRCGRVDVRDVKASFRKHADEYTHAAKVSAWCEDSLELLDVICELLPEHEALLRAKGMPFMAHLGYKRARAVQSTVQRLAAFLVVFRKFQFKYFPTASELTHKIG